MSWSYRILTPQLVDNDLALTGLHTKTTLALNTLRALLMRPEGVDEGIVRGQIDTALEDPAMGDSLLHSLFRADAARDLHTLYHTMDTLEKQMVTRQHESRHDLQTMLHFARTLLLTPVHRDRPRVREALVDELLTSLQVSKVPVHTSQLTEALQRLTMSVPPAHAPSPPSSASSSPVNGMCGSVGVATPPPACSPGGHTSHIGTGTGTGSGIGTGTGTGSGTGTGIGTVEGVDQTIVPPAPLCSAASPSERGGPGTTISQGSTPTPLSSSLLPSPLPSPSPSPSPIAMPSVYEGTVVAITAAAASAFVPVVGNGSGGVGGVAPPSPVPPSDTDQADSPSLLALLESMAGDDVGTSPLRPSPTDSDGGVAWLQTQLPSPSPPALASGGVGDSGGDSGGGGGGAGMMAVTKQVHVVALVEAADYDAVLVARRCGVSVDELQQFWHTRYPFDATPSYAVGPPPTCAEVPYASAAGGSTFELRIVSKHLPGWPRWNAEVHAATMQLLALVLSSRTHGVTTAATTAASEAPPTAARARARATLQPPGPVPVVLTPSNQCLLHVLGDIDAARLIREHVPFLRARTVHGKQVLEWCIIIKTLDATGQFRVFRLNNKPNNRYASVAAHDLYFPAPGTVCGDGDGGDGPPSAPLTAPSCATAVPTHLQDTAGGTHGGQRLHALAVLRGTDVHHDDHRLVNATFVVPSSGAGDPCGLYTANMFGGYLLTGWFTRYHDEQQGHDVLFHVFRAAPRVVYVYRDVVQAMV